MKSMLQKRATRLSLGIVGSILLGSLFQQMKSEIWAQQPTTPPPTTNQKPFVEILNSDYYDYIKTEAGALNKIVGNVKLLYGADTLYCDSAVLFQDKKIAEAFGNVSIIQADGNQAFANFMRYQAATKSVLMQGDVALYDNKGGELWSEEVNYNLATKVGTYNRNGTLISDRTTLTSVEGTYNLNTKDARFKKNVVVDNPEYTVTSNDLGYNTESQRVTFFAPSIVQNENSTMSVNKGDYYSKDKKGYFTHRASIIHNGQFIEADTLDYNQITGWGKAYGDVEAIDTAQKFTLYTNYAEYNELTGQLLAVNHPIMKKKGDKDSMFIFADTFFTAPINYLVEQRNSNVDSTQIKQNEFINELASGVEVDSNIYDAITKDSLIDYKKDTALVNADGKIVTNTRQLAKKDQFARYQLYEQPKVLGAKPADDQRYFLAYHNVKIFADSMQAICDSLRYSQSDTLMIMYKDPLLWSQNSQLGGDTIFASLDSNKIDEMYIPKNAIIVKASGPEGSEMYDQIQGSKLQVFFKDNKIDSLITYPNAATIYYVQDDDSAYVGASEASSNKLRISFLDQKINMIYYEQDFKQTLTPMQDAIPKEMRLSRFSWKENLRPKDLNSLMESATDFQRYKILGIPYPDKSTAATTIPKEKKSKKSKQKKS